MAHKVEGLPGFKWPIGASRVIAAPSNRVWEVISSPGLLPLYHPFCKENRVHRWPGPDSCDEVHYFSGWVFERNITNWIDGVGYELDIGRRGGRTSRVAWHITAQSEERCEICITVYPHGLQQLPVIARWFPHFFFLRPRLSRYLGSVIKGLDWFISVGEPVRRNQFGSHDWFSPPTSAQPESGP